MQRAWCFHQALATYGLRRLEARRGDEELECFATVTVPSDADVLAHDCIEGEWTVGLQSPIQTVPLDRCLQRLFERLVIIEVTGSAAGTFFVLDMVVRDMSDVAAIHTCQVERFPGTNDDIVHLLFHPVFKGGEDARVEDDRSDLLIQELPQVEVVGGELSEIVPLHVNSNHIERGRAGMYPDKHIITKNDKKVNLMGHYERS
jgi:hypothetical protein